MLCGSLQRSYQSLCPLIMGAGRPKRRPDTVLLYGLAHRLYWDLKTLADTEGLYRVRVDEQKLERLKRETENMQLSNTQLAILNRRVLAEIRAGTLTERDKSQRLRELADDMLFDVKFAKSNAAARESRRLVRVRGEPDIIEALLSATKPEQIVEICNDAFTTRTIEPQPGWEALQLKSQMPIPNWPISSESTLPKHLSRHAAEFVAAKSDPRFPRSSRPTNRLKQLWFLSRALAGAVYGLKTRTAINLVGSMRPEEMFHESRDGKPARKRMRKRIVTRRH